MVRHLDKYREPCEHYVYAVGGEFVQLITDSNGDDTVVATPILGYRQRGPRGKRRESLHCRILCDRHDGDLTRPISLFQTSPVSGEPDYTWGEVCRVYPPGSNTFKYLYGARNDTEARHADIKSRTKYLPNHVAGQDLRLLGASLAINAQSWAVHAQAHGQPNAIDNTA